MRGALGQVQGVQRVEITAQQRDITVHFDAAKTDVEQILAALEAAGEPAKPRQ